jgi:hypothetical protein
MGVPQTARDFPSSHGRQRNGSLAVCSQTGPLREARRTTREEPQAAYEGKPPGTALDEGA